MQIIFALPAENRVISLATIAEKTKLPLYGVEYLLMKSLSVHLVEGVIDQVGGTVHISWVQPRVLQQPQIAKMTERLATWTGTVDSTLKFLEGETPEFSA